MEHVAYNESQRVLGVPYDRPQDDPDSHSYLDLRRELHRIDEIPEVRGEPALRNLVSMLNDHNGCFRSLGCERWHKAPTSAEEPHQFGSYVGFALDAWPFISKWATQAIVQSFLARESPNALPDGVKMLFELRPTAFHTEQIHGWSLDVWVWGFGDTPDAAHASWERGIERFAHFVEFENKRWYEMLARMPGPASSPPFKIIKQHDPLRGCIPACAISVLTHHGIPAPTEDALILRLWQEQREGSGFARLREALGPHIRVDVEEPTPFGARLEQLTKNGQLVLVATKGEHAHCVIVEAIANNWVLLHDPGDGEPIVISLDSLVSKSTGDIATIHIL